MIGSRFRSSIRNLAKEISQWIRNFEEKKSAINHNVNFKLSLFVSGFNLIILFKAR